MERDREMERWREVKRGREGGGREKEEEEEKTHTHTHTHTQCTGMHSVMAQPSPISPCPLSPTHHSPLAPVWLSLTQPRWLPGTHTLPHPLHSHSSLPDCRCLPGGSLCPPPQVWGGRNGTRTRWEGDSPWHCIPGQPCLPR